LTEPAEKRFGAHGARSYLIGVSIDREFSMKTSLIGAAAIVAATALAAPAIAQAVISEPGYCAQIRKFKH